MSLVGAVNSPAIILLEITSSYSLLRSILFKEIAIFITSSGVKSWIYFSNKSDSSYIL